MGQAKRSKGSHAWGATVLAVTLGILSGQVGNAQTAPSIQISVDDAQVSEGTTVEYHVRMANPPAPPGITGVTVRVSTDPLGASPVTIDARDVRDHRLWFTQGVEHHVIAVRTTRSAATNTSTTVTAQTLSDSRFTIDGPSVVSATVTDYAVPVVNVDASTRTLSVDEGAVAQFVLTLDDEAQSAFDINFTTEITDGANWFHPTINAGHLGARTVRVAQGQRSATVAVSSYDNEAVNHDKTVTLTVAPGTGYTVGGEPTATAVFRGDFVASPTDSLRPGADTATLRWSGCGEDYLVEEGGTARVAFSVDRIVEADWSVTVSPVTGAGHLAEAATDYTIDSVNAGRIDFAPSDRRNAIHVNTTDNLEIEVEETFALTFTLSSTLQKSILIPSDCSEKTVRIRDDDLANYTLGPHVRRVDEGQAIVFTATLDARTGTECRVPFAFNHKVRPIGNNDVIASEHRAIRNANIAECADTASVSFDTVPQAGDQGTHILVFDTWPQRDAPDGRDARLRINGQSATPQNPARYIVYVDDTEAADAVPAATANTAVRLQGGNSFNEGRLEVLVNGVWGTVCDDYWRRGTANTACRMLGFADGSVPDFGRYTRAFFGAASQDTPIHLDDVRCDTVGDSLFSCRRRASGHNCRHSEDVGVRCVLSEQFLPVVSVDDDRTTLEVNEAETATFYVQRVQAIAEPLDVDIEIATTNGIRAQYHSFTDYGPGRYTVTIPADETRVGVPVTHVDDIHYSDGLKVALTVLESERYQRAASYSETASYNDKEFNNSTTDNEGADIVSVGWERCDRTANPIETIPFVVPEAIGSAEFDVVTFTDSLTTFDYSLVLVNMEGSASRHNDYVDADATGTLVVNAYEDRARVSVGIVDSKQLEETEEFEISLFRSGLTQNIQINECKILIIRITDDDTVNLTAGARARTVTEGDDIELDIVVIGENGDCLIPLPLEIDTTPAAGDTSALAQNSRTTVNKRFPPCTAKRTPTFETIASPGAQGTRTVHFDLELDAQYFRDRITLDDNLSGIPVRYTVHIVDDTTLVNTNTNTNTVDTNTNTNVPRNVDPNTVIPPTPIARILSLPQEHDGQSAFTFEFHLSPEPRLSYRTVRDTLFSLNGGRITGASRLVKRRNDGWLVTAEPLGNDAVTIVLGATKDCAATNALCTRDGVPFTEKLKHTVRGPVTVSGADASVEESEGATLDFEVSLSRAASGTTSVDYATRNGAASAGSDYDATSGTLIFAAGETRKTIRVTVHDDAHNEGSESMTLTLSNPSGVKLGDATATGTINNTDPMPTAWMIRAGRMVGSQVVEGLTERLDGGDQSRLIVGGMGVRTEGAIEDVLKPPDPFAITAWTDREEDNKSRTMTGDELLRSSAFHVSNVTTETRSGPTLSVWGRFADGGFEAKQDGVTTDGDVTTGLMGLDARWGRGLAGLMLSKTKSDGAYELEDDDRGTVESDLTGIYPYVSFDLNARISAWALAGMGTGELTLQSEQAGEMPTDLSMRLGAIGMKGRMLDGSGPSGIALNVKSDAMWVLMKNDDTPELLGTKANATRLRLLLQGERVFETERGAEFVPNAEIGIRHDSGDAETGTGIELGAGMRYRAGTLTIEGQVRGLIVHEAPGYGDWGLSGALRLNPSASGRGMTLSIAPQWGRTGSRAHQMWSTHNATGLGTNNAYEPEAQIAMDAGYGFGAGPGRGVLTPYAGLTLGREPDYTMRAGARWQLAPDVVFGVEHTQSRETSEVWARAALRF